MRFSDIGIKSNAIVGKKIEIEELFNKRILIEKVLLAPTKYPGKNQSGLRMQMQIVLATFNENCDADGDYFTKDSEGVAIGERRSCFTGSDILIDEIQRAESQVAEINKGLKDGEKPQTLFPIDTTIIKTGKCFQFK